MCFSERLTAKAGGYQEEHGYVLIGYKVFAQLGRYLMPAWPIRSVDVPPVTIDVNHHEIMAMGAARSRAAFHGFMHHIEAKVRMSDGAKYGFLEQLFRVPHAIMQPRVMLEVEPGEHPFHVAESEQSVLRNTSANPFGVSTKNVPIGGDLSNLARDFNPDEKIEEIAEPSWELKPVPSDPGVLCRVLVPFKAIDETNHVHAMVVIPPNERETEYEIGMCNLYNETHEQVGVPDCLGWQYAHMHPYTSANAPAAKLSRQPANGRRPKQPANKGTINVSSKAAVQAHEADRRQRELDAACRVLGAANPCIKGVDTGKQTASQVAMMDLVQGRPIATSITVGQHGFTKTTGKKDVIEKAAAKARREGKKVLMMNAPS